MMEENRVSTYRMKPDFLFLPYAKDNSKWIKDLNIDPEL